MLREFDSFQPRAVDLEWPKPLGAAVVDALGAAPHWTIRNGRAVWRPWSGDERWSRTVAVPAAPPFPEVSITPAADDAAVRAWRDLYVAGHAWDPPRDVPLAVWRELLPHGRVVRVARDRVVGIALVIADGAETRFVGGALDRRDPDAPTIARQLLAGAAGFVPGGLLVELDDWMWEVDEVVGGLPHEVFDRSRVVVEHSSPPETR